MKTERFEAIHCDEPMGAINDAIGGSEDIGWLKHIRVLMYSNGMMILMIGDLLGVLISQKKESPLLFNQSYYKDTCRLQYQLIVL